MADSEEWVWKIVEGMCGIEESGFGRVLVLGPWDI